MMNLKKIFLFQVPYANLYSSQPFYTCMENDGKSHGVVMVNSNAFGN